MSEKMTTDELRRAAARMGIPAAKLDRALVTELPSETAPPAPAVELYLPLRIILPWSALCSDNTRERATVWRRSDGQLVPRKVLTARYKAARDKTRTIARDTIGNAEPLEEPLVLVSEVWTPDARVHDVCNFAKCCHDALEKIVYVIDHWLFDTRWVRVGVDTDRPRAEITIRRKV